MGLWLKPLCNACACVAFNKSVVVFRAALPLQGAGEAHGARGHVENTDRNRSRWGERARHLNRACVLQMHPSLC